MEGWAAKKAVKRSREDVEEERNDATKELTAGNEAESLVKIVRRKFDQQFNQKLNPDSDKAWTGGDRDTGTAGCDRQVHHGDDILTRKEGLCPELTSTEHLASSVENSDNGLYLKKINSTNVITCRAVGGEAGGQHEEHDGGGDGVNAGPQLERKTWLPADRREGNSLTSDCQPDIAAADGGKTGSGKNVYTFGT